MLGCKVPLRLVELRLVDWRHDAPSAGRSGTAELSTSQAEVTSTKRLESSVELENVPTPGTVRREPSIECGFDYLDRD
jgi:hypothetical protein